jgi:general secretion pathway protein J
MKLLIRDKRRAAGFTLIELMLAVGLLGLILTMLWGSFAAISRSKVHAESRLITDEQARSVLWQISRELRSLAMTPEIQSRTLLVGEGQMQNGMPLDTITFATFDGGHRRSLSGFGAEQIVSYRAVPNPDQRSMFMLTRGERSALLTQVSPNLASQMILAENVRSLHFRYFDGSRWQESWNSQALPPGQNIPQAISVDLTLAGPRGKLVSFTTSVFLPIAFVQR